MRILIKTEFLDDVLFEITFLYRQLQFMAKSGETKQESKDVLQFRVLFVFHCVLCDFTYVTGLDVQLLVIYLVAGQLELFLLHIIIRVTSLMCISRNTSVGNLLNCLHQRPTLFASLLPYSFTNYTSKYFNLEWNLYTYWTTLKLVQVFRLRTCIREMLVLNLGCGTEIPRGFCQFFQ